MGNREDLLAGAQRCLHEKGYARTTARDIAAAAGVSLAAIGYHFGSKEALLNAALQQAIEEWGEGLEATPATRADGDAEPAEQFEAAWAKVLDSFGTTGRLWAIQFELLAHLERTPQLRETLRGANQHARRALVELFGNADEHEAAAVGAFYQALLIGAAALWLAEPETAPTARDLVAAVQVIATHTKPANDN